MHSYGDPIMLCLHCPTLHPNWRPFEEKTDTQLAHSVHLCKVKQARLNPKDSSPLSSCCTLLCAWDMRAGDLCRSLLMALTNESHVNLLPFVIKMLIILHVMYQAQYMWIIHCLLIQLMNAVALKTNIFLKSTITAIIPRWLPHQWSNIVGWFMYYINCVLKQQGRLNIVYIVLSTNLSYL